MTNNAPESYANVWNAAWGIGQPAMFHTATGKAVETTTMSRAYVFGGTARIVLADVAGSVRLDRVRPLVEVDADKFIAV